MRSLRLKERIMKYFLILNPGSHSGKSKKRFSRIFTLLNNAGIQYDYKITSTLEDAYTFSKEANLSNYDIVVAVGGDGTINNALNGFYDNSGKRISKAAFGIIYTGTSPDFCKSYGIPLKLEKAVGILIKGKTRKIKIGKIELTTSKDREVKYFGCCANIGLGAELARRANSGIRKYFGDFLGTFIALIGILFSYKPRNYEISSDSGNTTLTSIYNISVGITPLIASGIKVPEEFVSKGDSFYMLVARNLKLGNVIGVLNKIYSGKPFKKNEQLSIEHIKEIEIKAGEFNNEVEFDGDPHGLLPCKISLAEDMLEIIVGD